MDRRICSSRVALAIAVAMASLTGHGQTGSGMSSAATLPDSEAVKVFIASRVAMNWTAPHTPWGDPDIQGVFTNKDEANTPYERPTEWAGRRMEDITPEELAQAIAKRQQQAVETAPFAGGGEVENGVAIAVPIHWFDNLASQNSRPWFIIDPPDGQTPPMTEQALARAAALAKQRGPRGGHADSYEDRSLADRCITRGLPPAAMTPGIYGNSYQVLQTPDYVVIRYEMGITRTIPLDGRRHVGSDLRTYFGDGRGRWDATTLVVETTNFPERAIMPAGRLGTIANIQVGSLRLIERFTRIAPKKVEYTVTFDDPTVWTRSWTFSMPLTEDDTQLIYEYACHEGNLGLANILSAGRAAEKKKTR
jgi:hypothetical protein